eukprot:654742-Rhodomonas_salina.3
MGKCHKSSSPCLDDGDEQNKQTVTSGPHRAMAKLGIKGVGSSMWGAGLHSATHTPEMRGANEWLDAYRMVPMRMPVFGCTVVALMMWMSMRTMVMNPTSCNTSSLSTDGA